MDSTPSTPSKSIRLFLNPRGKKAGDDPWGDLGFDLLQSFLNAKEPVRAVSVSGTAELRNDDKGNRWASVADAFQAPFNFASFVNVVVSGPWDAARLYTDDVVNIFITQFQKDMNITPEQVVALNKYDVLFVRGVEGADVFRRAGCEWVVTMLPEDEFWDTFAPVAPKPSVTR